MDIPYTPSFPSISVIVDCILARTSDHKEAMWSSKDIPQEMADYIFSQTNNESHCHIEFADEFSNHLSRPRLWDWKAWRTECDRRVRAKKIAEANRAIYMIHKANMILLVRALEDMSFDKEYAESSAHKLLERGNLQAIRAVLADDSIKLITKLEDIPQWMERML